MSARARRLSVLLAVLLAVATPLAVAAASGPGGSTYQVKSGDTITSIAVQLRLPGGWEQLYKANKDRIGADPNRLEVGTQLTVPEGSAVPSGEGYVVQPGDTLNSIAGRLHVPGGGNALYAANRSVIGSDPNRLEVGQTLLPPGAAASRTPVSQAPKANVPPAALNHPAAPAPVAVGPTKAGASTQATHSGSGNLVLWSVLTGLLFVAFAVLVLFALPRRRGTSSQEVWVGGTFTADNQPAEPAKPRPREALAALFSRPGPSTAPTARRSEVPATPALVGGDRRDEPSPVQLVEPEHFRAPQPVQLAELEPWSEPQAVRLVDDHPAEQRQPAPREEPQERDAVRQTAWLPPAQPAAETTPRPEPAPVVEPEPQPTPAPATDVQSVVAGLQPGSVGRTPHPRRQRARSLLSYAVGGLRSNSRSTPGSNGHDLADELLGEVRLVDPSTPLTKDQRRAS